MTQAPNISFTVSEVRQRIAEIGEALVKADPKLPVHLAAIHRTLRQHEELVHILSPEEVTVLIAGQKKHVGVQLVAETAKKGRREKVSTNADDF